MGALPHLEGGMTPAGRATYHVETGNGGKIPCWCGIAADHTIEEFFAYVEEQNP